MMHKEILQKIRHALNSSRKVEITLKRESIRQVLPLLILSHSGYISIGSGDAAVLMAVFDLSDWEGDENRITTLALTDKFSESLFIGKIGRAIEKIQVVQ